MVRGTAFCSERKVFAANLVSSTLQALCASADEPWTEALFEDAAEGKLTLIVSPLRRLISKNNATIRDVGPPETVLGSVGAFITGTSPPDDEDVVRFILLPNLTSFSGSTSKG